MTDHTSQPDLPSSTPPRRIDRALAAATLALLLIVLAAGHAPDATRLRGGQTGSAAAPVAHADSNGEPASITAEQKEAIVASLTQPDEGPAGFTSRWNKGNLTVHVALPGSYAAQLTPIIDQALAYNTAATGVTFTYSNSSDADIVITGKDDNGGHVTNTITASSEIIHADVQLGCCRERVVFEELAQMMGPTGDHLPSGSVFSNDNTATRPSQLDTIALAALYNLPPAASSSQVRSWLNEQH